MFLQFCILCWKLYFWVLYYIILWYLRYKGHILFYCPSVELSPSPFPSQFTFKSFQFDGCTHSLFSLKKDPIIRIIKFDSYIISYSCYYNIIFDFFLYLLVLYLYICWFVNFVFPLYAYYFELKYYYNKI